MYLSIFFRIASLALGQSYDCPSASEATLKNMDKYITLYSEAILIDMGKFYHIESQQNTTKH